MFTKYVVEAESGNTFFVVGAELAGNENLAVYLDGVLMGYWNVDSVVDGIVTLHKIPTPLTSVNAVITVS